MCIELWDTCIEGSREVDSIVVSIAKDLSRSHLSRIFSWCKKSEENVCLSWFWQKEDTVCSHTLQLWEFNWVVLNLLLGFGTLHDCKMDVWRSWWRIIGVPPAHAKCIKVASHKMRSTWENSHTDLPQSQIKGLTAISTSCKVLLWMWISAQLANLLRQACTSHWKYC